MTAPSKPTPASTGAPDEESAAYWEGLRQHRLLLQRCPACGRHRVPALPSCPWCGGVETDTVEAMGQGRIYSWVTVHRPLTATWRHEVPYTVVVVDLAEGCRAIGRLLDGNSPDANGNGEVEVEVEGQGETPPGAGMVVTVRFVDHDDWTELCFSTLAAELS